MNKFNRLARGGAAVLAVSVLLAGCGTAGTAEPSAQKEAGQAAAQTADAGWGATKNTTRLNGTTAAEIALSTSRMIWPATANGTKPNVVLLVPDDSWQLQLAMLDLVHHPSDGPLLVTKKDSVAADVLAEIKRLNPAGVADGTQVITIGLDEKTGAQLKEAGFAVQSLSAANPAAAAAEIDAYYAEVSGELPNSVVIASSEQAAFAAPAGSWISHMPEPLLYAEQKTIPAETVAALKKRNGKAVMYILGPDSVISAQVEKELAQYGRVVRIAGKNPAENAIAFAAYKDAATGFGWGITKPGHGLVLANEAKAAEAIPALPFAHRGKHAPLLLTSAADKAPDALTAYLKQLKPLFQKEPTEGPYNHLYIVGGTQAVSNEQQGDLDHLIEIEAASGGGHGGHSGADQNKANSMDHGKVNHSNMPPENSGHNGHSGH